MAAAILIGLTLALTGCARSAPAPTHASPPSVSPVSPAPTAGAASAADTSTLDGISKDLEAADGANTQTEADQHTAEQAAATIDD
ncbi:MAG TPA: hypothetical protein VFK68_03860 [Propionibacteriaceae bacterium]|nr:hypothetical protein [Propionibacteriaceae bacterium]